MKASRSEVIKTDFLTGASYWAWYYASYYFGAERFSGLKSSIESRVLRQSSGDDHMGYSEVPSFASEDLSPQSFQRRFLRFNHPVVIRGLAKNWSSTRNWDLNYFRQNFGDQIYPVRKKSQPSDYGWPLLENASIAELIENIEAGGTDMASFLVDIFNRNPELREGLDLSTLNKYIAANPRFPIKSTQLFLSGVKGSTSFHCAPGSNLFVQIHGEKSWTFVAPRYTKWIYPKVREDMFYGHSPVCHNFSNIDDYPLFKKVPKLRVKLSPGDVLYSPQWWWHAVDNLSDSLGVACRAMTRLYRGNPAFALLSISSLNVLKNYYTIYKTGWNTDETTVKSFFKDRIVGEKK